MDEAETSFSSFRAGDGQVNMPIAAHVVTARKT